MVQVQLLSLLFAAAIGLVSADSPLELDPESFAETVGTGDLVFVKFFAPW